MKKTFFDRKAGLDGILAGLSFFLYSFFFIVAPKLTFYKMSPKTVYVLSSLFFLLAGFFTLKLLVGLYLHLKKIDEGFALWGLIIGVLAMFTLMTRGINDFTFYLNTPTNSIVKQVKVMTAINRVIGIGNFDARGFFSTGMFALVVLTFSYLMGKDKKFHHLLVYLGAVLGGIMIVVYLARLFPGVRSTGQLIMYLGYLTGFVLHPLWFIWAGWTLFKKD